MGTYLEPYAEPATEARRGLVRLMAAGGGLGDPLWRLAFEEVPRHLFVPYYFVPQTLDRTGDQDGDPRADQGGDQDGDRRGARTGGRTPGYERLWGEDPDPVRRERWLRGAYYDGPLATRVRDGELISSSSQPSLMALMLDALRVRYGDTVLEIGTGTGYNAALLCHRLGETLITTVDSEPEIVDSARAHLARAGYRPVAVVGDGARGCPERAPFDRIIATCTVPYIPYEWLPQCRPDALIVAPLSTGLVVLRVRGGPGGRAAEGRFLRTPAYFVPLRGLPSAPEPRRGPLPRRAMQNDLFRFLLELSSGGLDPHEALSLWRRERRLDRDRFGVTVRGRRQWAWLDDPAGPYVWPLGGQDDEL
ncbi:methyltransferase domain-containing protein [Streptomyces clavuligerus]|nr:methyltransferase domain-containing protein [Streptomyces clavuligerus]ANW20171.1 methyltransferase [Streptomyces clavuligerus]AXU14799.1 methyltransferase domain-containing protein [Streptomyces clavuligerus]MBY6304830.1 methyltransferase domain-containing protein [Streptomyces clavuligerus]QCS07568.1 methyltransferase domain-containing protein [Streptomyces clavuligerus]QPJ93087.1 methyltransferase domain-containing protein [Streptomyces clavuligerus]